MRRTKQWWAALDTGERSELVGLERASAWTASGGWKLPPDFCDCYYCSRPIRGESCNNCRSLNRLIALIDKADSAVKVIERERGWAHTSLW